MIIQNEESQNEHGWCIYIYIYKANKTKIKHRFRRYRFKTKKKANTKSPIQPTCLGTLCFFFLFFSEWRSHVPLARHEHLAKKLSLCPFYVLELLGYVAGTGLGPLEFRGWTLTIRSSGWVAGTYHGTLPTTANVM